MYIHCLSPLLQGERERSSAQLIFTCPPLAHICAAAVFRGKDITAALAREFRKPFGDDDDDDNARESIITVRRCVYISVCVSITYGRHTRKSASSRARFSGPARAASADFLSARRAEREREKESQRAADPDTRYRFLSAFALPCVCVCARVCMCAPEASLVRSRATAFFSFALAGERIFPIRSPRFLYIYVRCRGKRERAIFREPVCVFRERTRPLFPRFIRNFYLAPLLSIARCRLHLLSFFSFARVCFFFPRRRDMFFISQGGKREREENAFAGGRRGERFFSAGGRGIRPFFSCTSSRRRKVRAVALIFHDELLLLLCFHFAGARARAYRCAIIIF